MTTYFGLCRKYYTREVQWWPMFLFTLLYKTCVFSCLILICTWGVVTKMAPSTLCFLRFSSTAKCSSDVPGGVSTSSTSSSPQATSDTNWPIKAVGKAHADMDRMNGRTNLSSTAKSSNTGLVMQTVTLHNYLNLVLWMHTGLEILGKHRVLVCGALQDLKGCLEEHLHRSCTVQAFQISSLADTVFLGTPPHHSFIWVLQ